MVRKNLVIVVLYNKEMSESSTLKTLTEGLEYISKITIVNNGPKKIKNDQKVLVSLTKNDIVVELIECLENKPLSNIYNDIIRCNSNLDGYIILDDDSKLSRDYFECISNVNADVILPSIIESSNNKKYYPIASNKEEIIEGVNIAQQVYSISSGLVISRHTNEVFEEHKLTLFDERFSLYGVDTSFFMRLNYLRESKGVSLNVINFGRLYHSLSRVSEINSDFRVKERLIDELLTVKYYNVNKRNKVIVYAKVLIKCLIKLKVSWFFIMLNVIIKGKHPRSLFKADNGQKYN